MLRCAGVPSLSAEPGHAERLSERQAKPRTAPALCPKLGTRRLRAPEARGRTPAPSGAQACGRSFSRRHRVVLYAPSGALLAGARFPRCVLRHKFSAGEVVVLGFVVEFHRLRGGGEGRVGARVLARLLVRMGEGAGIRGAWVGAWAAWAWARGWLLSEVGAGRDGQSGWGSALEPVWRRGRARAKRCCPPAVLMQSFSRILMSKIEQEDRQTWSTYNQKYNAS